MEHAHQPIPLISGGTWIAPVDHSRSCPAMAHAGNCITGPLSQKVYMLENCYKSCNKKVAKYGAIVQKIQKLQAANIVTKLKPRSAQADDAGPIGLVPTTFPTKHPTVLRSTNSPSPAPTKQPTHKPTPEPTTLSPTAMDLPAEFAAEIPTLVPTLMPSAIPTTAPSLSPTLVPTQAPTSEPTVSPTTTPTPAPTNVPTTTPTKAPTTASCYDHVKGGYETDVDCGGPDCRCCAATLNCFIDDDCCSGSCKRDKTCQSVSPKMASCTMLLTAAGLPHMKRTTLMKKAGMTQTTQGAWQAPIGHSPSCHAWASTGRCLSQPGYMISNCIQACIDSNVLHYKACFLS
jgi:hypothetical protein